MSRSFFARHFPHQFSQHTWLGFLPRLPYRDLRGNAFECDCRAKWLMTWLKSTNATVSTVACAAPEAMKGKSLNEQSGLQNDCMSTGEQNPDGSAPRPSPEV